MEGASQTAPLILIVEDDADTLLTLEFMLTDAGYAVHSAASLPQAYEALDRLPIAAVITDSMALQTLDAIKQIQPLCDYAAPLPVGLITAYRLPEKQEVERFSFAFVLPKPFEIDVLLMHVAAMLASALDPATDVEARCIVQLFESMNQRDYQKALACCTPAIRYYSPTNPGQAIVGSTAYRAFMEQRLAAMAGITFGNVLVYSAPYGRAARYTAAWEDPLKGQLQASGAITARFQDDRITQLGNRLPTM